MSDLAVSSEKAVRGIDWKIVAAFLAIYVIWGSTFLAIRIAVLLVPPWFCAGIRFFTAGTLLFAFMRMRGVKTPSWREWRSLAVVGMLMFATTYGALFWAEQYVPSGITSVLEATMPLITVLLEVFVMRQQRFRWSAMVAIVVGFCGVALMVLRSGKQSYGVWPCLAILGGSTAWSLGAVLTRRLRFPESKPLTAGAEMMLGGAVLLGISMATGELRPFPAIPLRAGVALVYLILAGSLIGYTAFVYLLGKMPASRVASHAYVNPVVAIVLGYFVAAEEITLRTLLGAVLVIGSVALTLMERGTRVECEVRGANADA
jgi:drug/metabolite transporter (DMT)-like permease